MTEARARATVLIDHERTEGRLSQRDWHDMGVWIRTHRFDSDYDYAYARVRREHNDAWGRHRHGYPLERP